MNKMVINHLDKLFVTNDAATIVNELEVQHPTAKLLVLAGRTQQEEIGDGANLVVSFAGELLEKAEELIRMGLHPSDIIMGYSKAISKVSSHFRSDGSGIVKTCSLNVGSLCLCIHMEAIEILEDLMEKGSENMDVRNKEEVVLRMRSAVASKQFGQEDILCPLVADVRLTCTTTVDNIFFHCVLVATNSGFVLSCTLRLASKFAPKIP
jgi:T-complex protein 1 subunit theta